VTHLAFLSGGAAHGLVRALAGHAGVEVGGHFGAVGAMRERFLAGEPCDILILTHAQIAELCAQERAEPRMSCDLGSVATSVAVRTSDAAPDVASAEGLRAALLAADGIYFPDPAKATAGIHFMKVLRALGLAERPELRTFPNGATAMAALAQAPEADAVGCTQVTEILHTSGVRLVGPLPPGFELATTYVAAVAADAADRDGARDFVERLTGAASAELRRACGFDARG